MKLVLNLNEIELDYTFTLESWYRACHLQLEGNMFEPKDKRYKNTLYLNQTLYSLSK